MEKLFTLCLCIGSTTLCAQPVIDYNWFTSSPCTQAFHATDEKAVPVYPGGPDCVWDYSFLPDFGVQMTYDYEPVAGKNLTALPSGTTHLAHADPGILLFYQNTRDCLRLRGVQIGEQTDQYYDDQVYLRYPLTYGTIFRDTVVNSFGGQRRVMVTESHCDGYGVLLLPQDTFSHVLRLRIESQAQFYEPGQETPYQYQQEVRYLFLPAHFYAELLIIEERTLNCNDYTYAERAAFYNPMPKPTDKS